MTVPRSALRLVALYGTGVLVVGVDQLIKHAVVRELAGRPPVRLIGDFLQLRYATNSGGAFSLLTGAPVFFALMAVAVVGGILYASRRARGLPVALALGLLLGGAVGNLLDRLFRGAPLRGEVVDFVKVGPWPVFNLADSCIVVGGILLALLLGRRDGAGEPRRGGGPVGRAEGSGEPGGGEARPQDAERGGAERGSGSEAPSRSA